MLTQKCKEMSREQDAMIFIVSNKGKEEGSKISEHIYRTGYHFREVIVEAAREVIGETVISKPTTAPGFIEPIPDSQEEINEQADGAIRDLFPRIPNTDRQTIIEHAFKKVRHWKCSQFKIQTNLHLQGGKFHGETTVGLQPGIPLSRRVQLAVLAHIRHTHTRYDKLLRETTWMNARKVVEPVCLDVLMKWRGDEETGRDQLDEILREVVVITDSEEEDDDSSDNETSDEEGEVTSASSTEPPSNTNSRNQQRPGTEPSQLPEPNRIVPLVDGGRNEPAAIASRTRSKTNPQKDKKRQRGFNRYEAAWKEAISRSHAHQVSAPIYTIESPAPIAVTAASHNMSAYANNQSLMNYPPNPTQRYIQEEQVRYTPAVTGAARPVSDSGLNMHQYSRVQELRYSHPRSPMALSMPRNEVNMRPAERPLYHSYTQPRGAPPSYVVRERPSQVVRSSPVRHSPQDMPLPSIETSSNIVPTRADRHGDLHSTLNHSSGVYPRVVEERVQSPLQRQVIVIDDDSPHVKRRRVVREDENGHFRVGPVSSYDNDFHVPAPLRSDSQFVPVSSTQAGGFLVRQPQSSQSAQGLSRHRPSVFVDPATKEELPIFDHPANNHFARHPTHARPPNDEFDSEAQPINSHGMQRPVYADDVRRENFPPSFAQHARPAYSSSERGFGYHKPVEDISRYHDKGEYSGNVDRDLVHTFSQSRLHGSAPRPDNEFIVLSDRGNATRGVPLRYYEDDVPGSFAQASSTRPKSPVRYMERPV